MAEGEGKADEGKRSNMADELANREHPKVGPGGDASVDLDAMFALGSDDDDDLDPDEGHDDDEGGDDKSGGGENDDLDEGDDKAGDDDTGNQKGSEKSPKAKSFKTKEAAEKAHASAEKKMQEALEERNSARRERDNLSGQLASLQERLEKLESGDKQVKAEEAKAKILEGTAEKMAKLAEEFPEDPTDKKAVLDYNKKLAKIMSDQAEELAKLGTTQSESKVENASVDQQTKVKEYVAKRFKDRGLDKYLKDFYKIAPAAPKAAKTVDDVISWGIEHFENLEAEMKKAYDDKVADLMGDETHTEGKGRGRGNKGKAAQKKEHQPKSMADQINDIKRKQGVL